MPVKAIALQKLGELRLREPLQKDRPAYLSAASGLVRHGARFFVVADDELHLGIFATDDLRAELPLRLLPGKLPHKADKRKQEKPDFEALCLLPATAEIPHGALLVIGSGSRANRNAGLLLALSESGRPQPEQSLHIDFSGLFAALQREFGVVNIEGAVVQHDGLLLLQRGNKGLITNAIVRLDLNGVMREILLGAVDDAALRDIRTYALGAVGDVPLGFSDATCLPDGRLLALAVAEATDDAYVDGATLGSYLCGFDQHNQLQTVTRLEVSAKIEGVTVWSAAAKMLAFVSDADNPAIPSALYTARIGALF
jgi:hypothetical protein